MRMLPHASWRSCMTGFGDRMATLTLTLTERYDQLAQPCSIHFTCMKADLQVLHARPAGR